MRTRTAFFLLIATIATAAEAGVELRLRSSSFLPGTATDIIVLVKNDSAAPLSLQPVVALKVLSPLGESFFADRRSMGEPLQFRPIPSDFRPEAGPITVPAGTTFLFEVPFFSEHSFFRDGRFRMTGPYKLSAVMRTAANEEISSTEVLLNVVSPTGTDAEVWNRMTKLCGADGCWWGAWESELGPEILSQFPDSTYAGYAAGYRFSRGAESSEQRRIALRGPYREHVLLWEAVEELGSDLWRALIEKRQGDAERIANAQKRSLRELARSAESAFVRAKALAAVDATPTKEAITEFMGPETKPSKTKIKPIVNCASPLSEGGWIAWFGYENRTGEDSRIGTTTGNNKFEPKPHFRGQPETFLKDGQDRAFSVTFDGEPITWFIKGEKATASKSSPRCTP